MLSEYVSKRAGGPAARAGSREGRGGALGKSREPAEPGRVD